MDPRNKPAWTVPDQVFWAEIEEIDQLRAARAGGAADKAAASTPAFVNAVEAVKAVREAERALAAVEGPPGWLDRRRRNLPGPLVKVFENIGAPRAGPQVAAPLAALERARDHARHVARPTCGMGLVGLALSGGGIRSATFNLGVLQVLAKRGLLSDADYLSSVSGGGYVAGTLTTLLSAPGAALDAPEFPLRHERGTLESPAMKHLRRGASYLAPDDVLDRIRIPALALRGLIVNLLLLLPYLLWLTVATNLLWGPDLQGAVNRTSLDLHHGGRITLGYEITLGLAALLVVWSGGFPLLRRAGHLSWSVRNNAERAFALLFAIVVTAAIISTLPVAVWYYEQRGVVREVIKSGWIGTFATLVVPMLPLLLASGSARVLETWRGRVMIYALGLLGPVVLIVLYLEITTWRTFRSDGLARSLCFAPAVRDACLAGWGATVSAVERALSVVGIRFDVLDVLLLLLGGLLWLYGWRVVDVNMTALHGFYRDRISRAYLFREARPEEPAAPNVVPVDDLRMSKIGAPPRGPYHLVNATLNLQASRETSGRRADFFLFSKRFIGSRATGYCPTTKMEDLDPALDLGTAVAVSGAALAPNTGSTTNRALIFVMTLLNVRTGYWLPNPAKVEAGGKTFGGVGPGFLFLELFGLLNERSRYVNVSDGGHIENLGLYELLRRRCKYIVICDAENDPKLTFSSLAKVKQYALIDGSVDIDLDLTEVCGGPDHWTGKESAAGSRCCWAVGRVRYDSGEDGHILYLKASVTMREAIDLCSYRALNPAFPHESTSQQFFKEGQFEAYRSLGYGIADELFGGAPLSGPAPHDLAAWFEALRERSAPGSPRSVSAVTVGQGVASGNGSAHAATVNAETRLDA